MASGMESIPERRARDNRPLLLILAMRSERRLRAAGQSAVKAKIQGGYQDDARVEPHSLLLL